MKNTDLLKRIGMTVAVTGLIGMLVGCSGMSVYKYKDGDKYTPGDRDITEKIDTINLDYRSGDVTIKASSDNKITIRETSSVEINDEKKVHSWVNGSTLYVRYCESSARLGIDRLHKSLTITVPEGTDLEDLKINTASCNVICDGFSSQNASIGCASGNIDSSIEVKDYNINLTSGKIDIRQKGESNSVEINSTSGTVNADLGIAETLKIHSTSGKVNVSAEQAKDFTLEVTSGNSDITLLKAPVDSSIHVVSGDVVLHLPEDSDISTSASITSGDFDYDLPFKKQDGVYVAGTGENKMNIHLTSGDVSIKALN